MTTAKIFTLIPKIMSEVSAVGKNSENTFQHYKFRGIDDLYNAIKPVLTKHEVFCVPQVVKSKSEVFEGKDGKKSFRVVLIVNHKFYANDGSHIEVITQGEGIDTSDKASNKAMSGAMKYAFIELLSLPTADIDDADKDHPEIKTGAVQTSRQELLDHCKKFGWSPHEAQTAMISLYKKATVNELSPQEFRQLKETISSIPFQNLVLN